MGASPPTSWRSPEGARVLEVGCGPGRLSIRLARQPDLDVIGLDLDPAVIERARANADRAGNGDQRQPSFLVGDVAALAFPDGSFDLVVSTLSMHHWADPAAGLVEIGRVLRSGRALVWDFRPVSGHIRSDHVRGTCSIRLSRPMDAAYLADRNAFGHQAAVSATASVTR